MIRTSVSKNTAPAMDAASWDAEQASGAMMKQPDVQDAAQQRACPADYDGALDAVMAAGDPVGQQADDQLYG